MKKKFIATLLVLASISFNVYAENTNYVEPTVNIINYTYIDDYILSGNTTVKTNQNMIDKLFINYSTLREAEDDIEDAIEDMEYLISVYKSQEGIYEAPDTSNIDLSDPTIQDIYLNIGKIMLSLKNINNKNIATLEGSVTSMGDQLSNINKQQSDIAKLINKMRVQVDMINNQMIWTGENLVFTYNALEIQEKNIDKNLTILKDRLKVLNVQKDLGYVAKVDVDSLELNIEDLNYAKETLKLQKENIKRQLNLLLGQPYNTSVDIIFNPVIISSKLNLLDKETDLESTLKNSYTINLQRHELEEKEIELDSAEDDHGKYSNEHRIVAEELDDLQLKFDDIKRTQELKFQQTYESVKDKQKALTLEEKKLAQEKTKLEAVKKKYNLGMISKVEYDNSTSSYDLQSIKVETAKGDLFTAYRKYEWMLKGLSV